MRDTFCGVAGSNRSSCVRRDRDRERDVPWAVHQSYGFINGIARATMDQRGDRKRNLRVPAPARARLARSLLRVRMEFVKK